MAAVVNAGERYAVTDGDPYNGAAVEWFRDLDSAVGYADSAVDDQVAGTADPLTIYVCRPVSAAARWDWGLRGPDGRVSTYVNENAARNCASDTYKLVKMRRGNPRNPWQPAD